MIPTYSKAMKAILTASIAVALVACSEPPPPPKPAAPAAATPTPQAEAPKAPETKAPEAPKPDPNKELASRVKRALEGEAKIQGAGIDVTAADGRVTLWGTTATAAERNRAAQVAAKVEGVTSVDNQLKVVKGS
jgi:hyperosmotically inducible protein